MGEEKRRAPRIPIKFLVECRGENVWQSAETDNLSKGGLFVVTDKIEPKGTRVEIFFDITGERAKNVQIEGVVAWVRDNDIETPDGKRLPRGMGVQFIKIFSSEGEEFLEKFVKLKGEYE